MGVRGAISDNSEPDYARLYKQSVFCPGAHLALTGEDEISLRI
jgi:hypothetical protein